MAASLTLGAPGVYREPAGALHALTGIRMDVAGFAGVAPRGPARVPVVDERHPAGAAMVAPGRPRARSVAVPVGSWEEYREAFGGFDGPGRLPWAVASFFAQGGRRAWVVRVVHDRDPLGPAAQVAVASLAGVRSPGAADVRLHARSEGSWGNALRATLRYAASPLVVPLAATASLEPGIVLAAGAGELRLTPDAQVPEGTLLRLTLKGGARELRWVAALEARPRQDAIGADRVAILDLPASADVCAIELVHGELQVDDGDGRRERFERLGLHGAHPRWVAAVLCDESALVWPDHAWATTRLVPQADLHPAVLEPPAPVADDYPQLVPEDMFDADWIAGDAPDTRLPGGVHALLDVGEVASVCLPDLYEPEQFEAPRLVGPSTRPAGATFDRCLQADDAAAPAPAVAPLRGLTLDPRDPRDLEAIARLQGRLVALAEHAGWSALLDVPPGLGHRDALRWRARFDSAAAAAYAPWLVVAGIGPDGAPPRRVPPSAVAAGIVAAVELRDGLAHGPAGVVAARVVAVAQPVTGREHDELHLAGINVFALDRDGVRLTAARTLAGDPQWRQLSVRRLVSMIGRALRAQMTWAAFEPADETLRSELRHVLDSFLRELHARGTLAGARPADGFFVRCDDTNNPPASVDAGRLVVDVGVAPVEPLEYIVLRLVRGDDGNVRVGSPRA